MKRILTGIQSSGMPHLGNILGAILPALSLATKSKGPACLFIADLHTLTSQRDKTRLATYTRATAAAWLACGVDTKHHLFYRQSRIPQVTELTWYLSCITPYPMLANAHAFKEKAGNLAKVNAGLVTYPVLMAADITLYEATHVPVGEDQRQHLEITRNLVQVFNHHYGPVLTLPAPLVTDTIPTILGTDGRKMSKSYGNTLSPFMEEEHLRKAIMRIPTDSKPLAAPKDPGTCPIYRLYTYVAPAEAQEALHARYLAGNMGYGSAKQALFEMIMARFAKERTSFFRYMEDEAALELLLQEGEYKARDIANATLDKVRKAIGYLAPHPTLPAMAY